MSRRLVPILILGTAPEQQGENGAPDDQPDRSRNNRIHHNTIATAGNECVDVKENSTANIVEYNDCSQQKDPSSGGLDARGAATPSATTRSTTTPAPASGSVATPRPTASTTTCTATPLTGNDAGGIKFMRTPQGQICGNTMSGNTGGNSVGTYGADFDPTGSC